MAQALVTQHNYMKEMRTFYTIVCHNSMSWPHQIITERMLSTRNYIKLNHLEYISN